MSRARLSFSLVSLISLVSFASLAGCAPADPAAPAGERDLRGNSVSMTVGETRVRGEALTTRVTVDGEVFTVSAEGARVAVAREGGAQMFWMDASGAKAIDVGGVDERAGESYEGSLPRAGESGAGAEALSLELELGADQGLLSDSDRDRLNLVLPVALEAASSWSHRELGAGGDRASATVRAYAAALLVPSPAEKATAPAYEALAGTGCSYYGADGCHCSVSCQEASNIHAECTSCNRCVCVIGASGSGMPKIY